jgi:hypothetical protein
MPRKLTKPQPHAKQPLIACIHCEDKAFQLKAVLKDSTLEEAKEKLKTLATIAINPKYAYIYSGNGQILYEYKKWEQERRKETRTQRSGR